MCGLAKGKMEDPQQCSSYINVHASYINGKLKQSLFFVICTTCPVLWNVWRVSIADEVVSTGAEVGLGLMTDSSMIRLQKNVMAKDKI